MNLQKLEAARSACDNVLALCQNDGYVVITGLNAIREIAHDEAMHAIFSGIPVTEIVWSPVPMARTVGKWVSFGVMRIRAELPLQ